MVNVGGYSIHLVFGNIILVTVLGLCKRKLPDDYSQPTPLAILQRPFSGMVPDIKRNSKVVSRHLTGTP